MCIICTPPCYATSLSGISEVVVYAVAGTLVAIMGDVGACASVACPLSSSCLVRRCGGGAVVQWKGVGGQGSEKCWSLWRKVMMVFMSLWSQAVMTSVEQADANLRGAKGCWYL